MRTKNKKLSSFVIALLTHRQSNRQPIAPWRKRAGRVGSVGTRRVFQAIEIEHQWAGLIQAVGGKARIEKAAGAISSGLAGRVAKDKEKFCNSGIFEHRFKHERLSLESELRSSGNGLIVARADERSERDGLERRIGSPLGGHAIRGIGREPLESAETQKWRRMRILDAQSEALLPADDKHIQSADGDARGNFVLVGFDAECLRLCLGSCHKQVLWEAFCGRMQRHGFAFEMQYGKMRGRSPNHDFIVRRGADCIVSSRQPLKVRKRKPAVWF